MTALYATRADGWPLCPICHEDELYSFFAWDGMSEKPPMQAWIDAGLRCYRCGFDSQLFTPVEGVAAVHAAERAALVRDICAQLTNGPLPGSTPARDPVPTPAPPPQRFVKFGDAMICTVCQLDVRYCKGHAPAAPGAKDGAESSLEQRIADCMGAR